MTRSLLWTVVLVALGLSVSPAFAQMPLVDPSGRTPATPPAPTPAPPTTVVIPVGPDGQPVAPPAPAPGADGYYYDDSFQGAADEPAEVHSGPLPELHVIRSGDTLWDICWYYFNDPWQWPKIWSFNPSITNPHWIYPGDLVRLLPRGLLGTSGTVPVDPDGGDTADSASPSAATGGDPDDRGLGSEPAPARRFGVQLRQFAFLENQALESPMRVEGAVEGKELLAAGDGVYVSYPDGRPPQIGKRYSIYTLGNRVRHPKGGSVVGAYVHILGQLEIENVKKGKMARAIIVESNAEIERGAYVGPLVTELKTVPPAQPKVDAQGTIVALLEKDQLIGSGEVIFVDLGKKSGIEVGNRMYVVRRGDALEAGSSSLGIGQDDRRFPARALGEIVIVEVGKEVSIGLVTLAVQEMGIGDLVMMQKAK